MFVPLPLGVDDAVERLRQVAVAAAGCKQHVIPAPAGGPNRSRLVRRLMMRFAARQRWADVYVANVPGPRAPLYLAGAQVQELYPVVPLAGRVPVGVGALSYAGRLGITVVADRGRLPRHRDLHRRPARGAGRAGTRRVERRGSAGHGDRGRAREESTPMSDISRRTNGVPLPARIDDGQTHSARSCHPPSCRCSAGAGARSASWSPTARARAGSGPTDVEGLARLGIVAAAAVGVAAAVRRPSARVDRLSMGPGGWVSFRGFPAPKGERRRPWWAVLLRAHRVT